MYTTQLSVAERHWLAGELRATTAALHKQEQLENGQLLSAGLTQFMALRYQACSLQVSQPVTSRPISLLHSFLTMMLTMSSIGTPSNSAMEGRHGQ